MDRFIVCKQFQRVHRKIDLKSNMDRFIELIQQISLCQTQI